AFLRRQGVLADLVRPRRAARRGAEAPLKVESSDANVVDARPRRPLATTGLSRDRPARQVPCPRRDCLPDQRDRTRETTEAPPGSRRYAPARRSPALRRPATASRARAPG